MKRLFSFLLLTLFLYPRLILAKIPSQEECVKTILRVTQKGREPRLRKYARACVDQYPKSDQLHHFYGLLLMQEEKFLAAALHFKKAYGINPKNPANPLRELRCYVQIEDPLKRYKRVLEDRLLRPFSHDPGTMGQAGNILVSKGKFKSAFSLYENLASSQKEHSWFYLFKQGQILMMNRQDNEALPFFEKALEANRERGAIYLHLARAHLSTGNPRFALSYLSHARKAGFGKEFQDLEKRIVRDLEKIKD